MTKLLRVFAVLAASAAVALCGQHHTLTLTYAAGQVIVAPGDMRAAVGDTVTVQTGTRGAEFTLVLADGTTVQSHGGAATFTVKGYGHFDCTMTVNGQQIEAEYGGDIQPGEVG